MTVKKLKFEDSVEFDLSCSNAGANFLEKYTLMEKIHQGMLSHVFIIQDKKSRELYILKAIELDRCSCDIDLMMKINHPNIVKVYDYFETEKHLYIRKEYIMGITLEEYLNQNGPLEENAVTEIAVQLCAILSYLHTMDSSPIIYRDLKPANIIIQDNGNIKLIDLDSIRQFKENSQKDTIYIGTEGFAPPEQFGFGQTDIRSDIYTLGTTLFHLLTNQEPVADQLKLKYIKKTNKNSSKSLGKILEKCTRFHPDNRYQNIHELQKDLMGISSENYIKRAFYRLKLILQKTMLLALTGIISVLLLVYLIYISIIPRYQSSPPDDASSKLVLQQDKDTGNNLHSDTQFEKTQTPPSVNEISYTEFVGAYEPVIDLDKIGINEAAVISLRLEKDGKVIPIQFEINGAMLTLINKRFPVNLLDINCMYSLTITTIDNSIHQLNFIPMPQEISDLESVRVYYMPANPQKGFYYPYFITLPSKESMINNKGKNNYLLIEPYDMYQSSDELEVHLDLAIQNAQSGSLTVAEELGLPRLIPVFIKPESSFNNKEINTHALSRNTILLDLFKKTEVSENAEIFEHMDRIDLQLIEMIKDANEFLGNSGLNMQDRIFIWGKGEAGDFANRFTLLHPELVKAAFYQGLPILPISTLKDTKLPYPFGTADYKNITGSEFNLEAYNQVAKLGFILAQDEDNPVYPDMKYSTQEKEKIYKLLPPQEYPVRWLIVKDLYIEAGLKAQVNLYEDYTLLDEDSINFLEANRKSDLPIYMETSDTSNAMTAVFSDNQENITGQLKNEITIQKATINEAFWSGVLPKTLNDDFITYYTSGDAWHYNPFNFFISILEWDSTRDHRQMAERVFVYGDDLILKADGYKDVQARITEGSMTFFNGGYLYFVELVNGEDMVSGIQYKLIDRTGNWVIKDKVTVERPILE